MTYINDLAPLGRAMIATDLILVAPDGSTQACKETWGSVILGPANFTASFLAWMASLPTTLPSTPGVAWNNGGVPCVS
jgi:hypothetical protein